MNAHLKKQTQDISSAKKQVSSAYNAQLAAINAQLAQKQKDLLAEYNAQIVSIKQQRASALACNDSEYDSVLAKLEDWYQDQIKSLSLTGFKTGGIVSLEKSKGEDGITLARNGEGFVSPEDVPEIQNLLHSLPQVNDVMSQFLTVPKFDYSNIPIRRTETPIVNLNYDNMINIEGNMDEDVWSKIKPELPKISQQVQKDIYQDLKKTGALRR